MLWRERDNEPVPAATGGQCWRWRGKYLKITSPKPSPPVRKKLMEAWKVHRFTKDGTSGWATR